MISTRPGRRAVLLLVREAGRNALMMSADRSTLSRRAIFFLLVTLGFPGVARPATLEDSARQLARKIAEALPGHENVTCEIRNLSSLPSGDAARIEQAVEAELRERGVALISNGAATTVLVTLSENFRSLVWTAEIRKGETPQVVLIDVDRPLGNSATTRAMPVTIHSEKFWEGPERILDAGEISNNSGKSWLVLLFPDGLRIQDRQTGLTTSLQMNSLQSASRDPWGNLNVEPVGNTIGIFLAPRACTLNLETLDFGACLGPQGSGEASPAGSIPVMFDIAPEGPPPPGKGTVVEMQPVCGGASQFLATGGRDYTQTDSLQVFENKPGGAQAVSAELDFPGPIMALHSASAPPRAVVRNLATGNYEAYRLSFSCAP